MTSNAQVRLDGEEKNRRQILQHENAQGDAAGESVELLFFIEHFHDDDRAAERGRQAEIKGVPGAAAQSEPEQPEKQHSEERAAHDLDERGQGDRPAGTHDFFQVDLEPDHEEKKNETELGDGG